VRDDQRRQLAEALLKVVAVAVGVGAVIAIGIFIMVQALGFSDNTPAAHSTSQPDAPSTLPTEALTASGSPSPSEEPSATATSKRARPKNKIKLSATPEQVGPGERINLTGSYPGADNVALQVQRKENDVWVPFADVQTQVRVGTFETYVITSRLGGMKFRVFDPTTHAASNAVGVTVG
jgi:hypothetical protein